MNKPLKDYLKEIGYTEEGAEEMEHKYQMLIQIMDSPGDLYDIFCWLGWFDE